MINWLRRRWRWLSPRYRVACAACGAESNPMVLDVAGLWAALHPHLCPAGATEDDLVLTFECG